MKRLGIKDLVIDDKPARYARSAALLDKWTAENVEFDARVEPQIDEYLREWCPRHFQETDDAANKP